MIRVVAFSLFLHRQNGFGDFSKTKIAIFLESAKQPLCGPFSRLPCVQISTVFCRSLHKTLDKGSGTTYICLVLAVCVSSSARFTFRKRRWQCTAAHSARTSFSRSQHGRFFVIDVDSVFSQLLFLPVPVVRSIFRRFRLFRDAFMDIRFADISAARLSEAGPAASEQKSLSVQNCTERLRVSVSLLKKSVTAACDRQRTPHPEARCLPWRSRSPWPASCRRMSSGSP